MTLAYDYERNLYGFLDDDNNYLDIQPDEMNDFLTILISNSRKCKVLWVFGLNFLAERIQYLLWYMGYNDVTMSAPPVKNWHTHDYDYILSDDGKAFRFRIKSYDKSTLYILNADNIIGNNIDNICKDFMNEKRSMEVLTRAVYNAIFLLVGEQKKKIPFTISMIAAREWRKWDEIPFKCAELNDCHTSISPVEGMTLDEYLTVEEN